MLKCENSIVNFIAKFAQVNYNGSLNCNSMYIKWKYNVNMLKQNIYECNHVIRQCAFMIKSVSKCSLVTYILEHFQ